MSKSNKNDWKNFEHLIYEYVTHLYKGVYTKEKKWTEETHDSGYDGIWVILPENHLQYQTILMEAKYRKSQVSLPLHDCAKAIIIAFNMAADKLYIASNIAFAPQTKAQIALFNQRSDLAIVCVNAVDLVSFIQNNKEYLLTNCDIEKDFLEEIEKDTEVIIDDLIDAETHDIPEEYLEDDQRKTMVSEITSGFIGSKACLMLTGNEGVGKSTLGNIIREQLIKSRFDVCKIDVSICPSSRVLYLKVLEAIWGTSLHPILEDEQIDAYIDLLIAVNGDEIDRTISTAVKHILATSYYEYEGHKDNYLYSLLKYLDIILGIRKNNFRLAIFFDNLNTASEEVLDFLLQIIDCLKRNQIRILLEVRTPFLLSSRHDTQKSEFYYKQLDFYSDKAFPLDVIEHELAVSHIQHTLALSRHVCDHLANMLGDNLLDIQSAIKVLEKEEIPSDDLEHMDNGQLEEYWNDIGLSANTVIVSLIRKLRTIPILSNLFEIARIFRGEIPCQLLESIHGNNGAMYIKTAIDSTVFKQEGENLVCRHLRFLKAIEETSEQYIHIKMVKKILPIIQAEIDASARYPYIELDILYILNKVDDIPHCVLNIMSLLIDTHQYREALNNAMRYIDFRQNMVLPLSNEDAILLQILIQTLMCLRELHAENEDAYSSIYQMAHKYILLDNPNSFLCKNWYKYRLFLWHKEFVSGKFEKAYEISQSLVSGLDEAINLFKETEDYPGQVYNAYGLSIKMISGGTAAENIFREGVQKYPNSYYGKAALLSQEANSLLKTDPSASVSKYLELLETVKGKEYPFQEILHTRIDVAMASFLAGNYEAAIVWANDSINVASSVGIYFQKGRALNILGCCHAAQGLYDQGIKTFKESYNLLSYSTATIYMWRAQLNCASTLLCLDKKKEALELLYNVLETLQEGFTSKIKSDIKSVPYKSFLLILMYLYKIKGEAEVDKILQKFNHSTITEDFLQLSKTESWKETFQEKVKYCGEIILVTG